MFKNFSASYAVHVVDDNLGFDGKWTVEELARVFPATIGLELYNPAPSQVRE